MKNLAIITGLILATSTHLFAQEFGVKAGLNLNRIDGPESSQTNYYGESSYDYTSILGFSAGVSFEYGFNDNLGFTTGLNFTQKGTGIKMSSTYDYNDGFGNSTVGSEETVMKIVSNYIEFPLMLKAGFNVGKTKVYGLCGGAFGVALFGKWTYETESEYTEIYNGQTATRQYTESESESIDYGLDGSEMINLFNIGLVPGIGAEFGNIQVETTYNLGLNNMLGDNSDGYRGNSFNFTVGYKFNKN